MPGVFKSEAERQEWHRQYGEAKATIADAAIAAGEKVTKAKALAAFDTAIEVIKLLPLPPKVDLIVDAAAETIHTIVHALVEE